MSLAAQGQHKIGIDAKKKIRRKRLESPLPEKKVPKTTGLRGFRYFFAGAQIARNPCKLVFSYGICMIFTYSADGVQTRP